MRISRFALIAAAGLPLALGGCGAISTYNNASSRIAQAKQDEGQAQARLTQTRQKHDELTAEEAAMTLQRDALSAAVSENRAKLDQVRKKLRTAQTATADQQAQIKRLNDRLSALQDRVDRQEANPPNSAVGQQELDRMDQEKRQIEQQIKALQAAL